MQRALTLVLKVANRCCSAVVSQSYSCSAGTVANIKCYIDDTGYISDVQYHNTPGETFGTSTVCQSTKQQLSATKSSSIYLAVGECVTAIAVCSDTNGARGLVFSTSLGQSYSCGSQVSGCALQQGTAALGGFAASCSLSSNGLQRLLGIADICWTPNYSPPTTPKGGSFAMQATADSAQTWLALLLLQRPSIVGCGIHHHRNF